MAHTGTPAPWHARDAAAVLDELASSPRGLKAADAAERQQRFGPNALTARPPDPAWKIVLRQFRSPLIAILIVAAAVTLLLQDYVDAIAIVIVLVLNATIGFWQELRADREMRALASLTVPAARVVRDGHVRSVSATELVPGDVVALESGERVPADLRLLDAHALLVDESMLTGESESVHKTADPVAEHTEVADRTSMLFSGTFATSGRAHGVVVAIGADTELGVINELVQGAPDPTPLQLIIRRLERRIGLFVGLVAAIVFVAGALLGEELEEIFLSAVSMAVATIPEALPVVLTIALAIGVRRMAARNAIVRTLPAVETLGSTTVIASDKTGTLTQNRLTAERLWTARGFADIVDAPPELDETARAALRTGALVNECHANAESEAGFLGDTVDVALAVAARGTAVVGPDDELPEQLAHLPYEPQNGYAQSLRDESDGLVLHVKGAPELVLAMCSSVAGAEEPFAAARERVLEANAELAREGYRVLALARRRYPSGESPESAPHGPELPHPSELELLGLIAMTDPPRPEARASIEQCRAAGLRVIMITGDHPLTATTIADRLGIAVDGGVITGVEVGDLDDDALRERLRTATVAARVSPTDKLRIVRALQQLGHTVAVTGDGVNDAPALKAAAIGVAMGRAGTDVAREASDVVLTDDRFATIVEAVRQGRVTFAAIRKATFFLLSTGFGIMLAVAVSVFLDQPLLFLPIQVLWLNVVTSGLQDVALAFEPEEGDELRRPPRPSSEGILSRALWGRTVVTAIWMAAVLLLAFAWALSSGYALDHARTLVLTLFVIMSFFQSGSARTEHRSLFTVSPVSNPFLIATALGAIGLQALVMTWGPAAAVLGLVPLTLAEWAGCAIAASSVLVIVELDKFARRLLGRRRLR
ncbi:HAD-IC family P-type ATPase [Chryseoglobus sp. 28M-23]|uniref:cation-translocating P-type ATPase n=1 Tax=Chryseoglobus sp. 28M-23 TaxID=2772253 RepID=UPI001747D4A9|nr:HAD-IC family P-type ATPase [Chryseoglobus sp. 28M-23]QOD92926.1 HAD-IC family P-type ATPase [Chryseoglobus sp. 28M-23]